MVDVCVIGGGPAGLFSAYYCQSRGLQTMLLEADQRLGGRIHLFEQLKLYDVPGMFGVTGADFLQSLLAQYKQANVPTTLAAYVRTVEQQENCFNICTETQCYQARTVIVATGNGFLQYNSITSPAQWKPFIHYMLQFPKNIQDVAVIGANPMAVDWALQLEQAGHRVTLFTERLERIQPILMLPLQQSSIDVQPFDNWRQCQLQRDGLQYRDRMFQSIFVHVGTKKQALKLPRFQALDNGITTIPGLFIAGDIRHEAGKLKLIVGAIHDAMQAANSANQFIHPQAHYQPVVSTHDATMKGWDE